jgi:hypothetical protein
MLEMVLLGMSLESSVDALRSREMGFVIHNNQTIDIAIPANRDMVRREMAEQGIERLDTIDDNGESDGHALTPLRRHDACTYTHNPGDDCVLCDALTAARSLAAIAQTDPLGVHRRKIAEDASETADREVRAFMRAVSTRAIMPEKLLDYVK